MPCSRSRTIAAPARMIASIVTLLMIPITLVNQADVRFGLKAMRTSRSTGAGGTASRAGQKVFDLLGDDLLGVAGADARLHHRGGVHVDLDRGLASPQQVALKVGRDVDGEGVARRCSSGGSMSRSAIGRGGLKYGGRKAPRDPPGQRRLILVDDADRGVVQLLQIAPGLR